MKPTTETTRTSTPLMEMSRHYALDSKERFPSYDPATQEKREGTMFYGDFKVAEAYLGSEPDALDDTWRRVWAEWKGNCKYCVELCVVMNHLCWEHHGRNETLCEWYARKYHFVNDRIFSSGSESEPLPEGCKPFTAEEHTFAFDVLD